MREEDWPAVQQIYREGIATGHATFESEAPDWERFNASRLPRHRLVAETSEGRVLWLGRRLPRLRPHCLRRCGRTFRLHRG